MTRSYKAIVGFLLFLVRLFFRRVIVTGMEHIPRDRGGILISWHPNGLIDPGLIVTHFPRRIVFGARHGLFKWPILGFLMRGIGTVPIYRADDNEKKGDSKRRHANSKSIEALARSVSGGAFSALFPEGVSHDDPRPRALKKGGARLYYMARELQPEGALPPVIIPVGLHYDAKSAFRSNVLVAFHPPVCLSKELDITPTRDESLDVQNERVSKLTAEFDRVLEDVVHATENWTLHHILHRTRSLVHAERTRRSNNKAPHVSNMEQRVEMFSKIREIYYREIEFEPSRIEELKTRVAAYDADLHRLDMEDHELDGSSVFTSNWLTILLGLQLFAVHVLLPPLIILGLLINAPAIVLLMISSRIFPKLQKDKATVKLLSSAVLFPLSWIGASVLVAWGHINLLESYPAIPDVPVIAGITSFIIGILGGATALGYRKLIAGIWHSARVRFTRKRRWYTIERLLGERSDLHDELVALADKY